jgi:hypothetical protein
MRETFRVTVVALAFLTSLGGLAPSNRQAHGETRARAVSTQRDASGADWHFINVPRFTIPFQLAPDSNVVEVQLYASSDSGKTWTLAGRQRPDQQQFAFEPPTDGEYWLSSRTLDRDNRVQGNFKAGVPVPQLKLVVDRRSPSLKLEARPEPSGRIHLTWDASDPYLDSSTMRLEFRAGADGPWRPIELKSDAIQVRAGRIRGEMYWYPDTISRVLTVRGEVYDRAGNRVVDLVDRIFLPRVADTGGQVRQDASNTFQPSPEEQIAGNIWPRRQTVAEERQTTQLRRDQDSTMGGLVMHRYPRAPAGDATNAGEVGMKNLQETMSDVSANPVSAQPGVGDSVEIQNEQPKSRFDTGNRELAAMTSKTRFHLEYDLQFVGPEGAAEVQLWCTRDRGSLWEKWGSDRDLQSPLDVQVDEEGLYGFCIVIVGKNGLSSAVPKPNSAPDLWVGVDLSDPTAHLTTAAIGRGTHAGHVDIRWDAADDQLSATPVTLSFSTQPDGDWQVIAAKLENNGQYFWRIDNSVPQTVYLKMTVVDASGRTAESVLAEPVDTRQVAPRGRIRGVLPAQE